jgi:poly [ADP-ribose] polymerase
LRISLQKVFSGTNRYALSKGFINTTTVKQAEASGIKIVNLDWLLDSIAGNKKMPEKKYLLSTSTTDKDTAPPVGKKRGRAAKANTEAIADSENEDTKPPAKKQARNGKSKSNGTSDSNVKIEDTEASVPEKYGQKASGSNLVIPVDDCFSAVQAHQVYIDEDDTIWDASLNQANSGANNNKFYILQLLKSSTGKFVTWTRWGRVGNSGQTALLGDGSLEHAKKEFEKKFRDKSGLQWANRLDPPKGKGKYTFIERSYEPDSDDDEGDADKKDKKASEEGSSVKVEMIESKLPGPVQELLGLIFNASNFQATMADMSYDSRKLPLGKLSKRTIGQGLQALKGISELMADPTLAQSRHGDSYANALEDLSNTYYTVIPHVVGQHRIPIINNQQLLKKEIELLDSLGEMSIANEIMKQATASNGPDDLVHPADRQYDGLGMKEMTPCLLLHHPNFLAFTDLRNFSGSQVVGVRALTELPLQDTWRDTSNKVEGESVHD